MMKLLYLFLLYSFLGWIIETVNVILKEKKIVNRGFLNGPFCMLYGFGAVLITMTLPGLREEPFFLFLGSVIYTTFLELCSGRLLEAMYQTRWWDYSKRKFNFDGYICLSNSVLWGLFGVAVVKWLNPVFLRFYRLWPFGIRIIVWVFLAVMVLDFLGTNAALSGNKKQAERYRESNRKLAWVTAQLRSKIYGAIEKRIWRAHAVSVHKEKKEKSDIFAEGCGFYKIFWLFFVGAFLGDLIEVVFCRFSLGWWMSRSSVVWGPFSIVWGLGIAIFTLLLYQYRERSDAFLFMTGTLLGGAFEYFCSVFTEIVFGTIFWDYSKIPFNLAGRINLLFCFFWGIAAVIWFRALYGKISGWIEKIPMKAGKILTWILVVFMTFNMLVSAMALGRYEQRQEGAAPKNRIEVILDERFDDERMKKIYPKAKRVERSELEKIGKK